ncbi:MAG: hypothetical protein RTU63_08630 [Candidatus Thorarchaeota archaeon]
MADRDSLIEKIREVEKELIKHPNRTRQEIVKEIFESKMYMIGLELSKDSGYIPLSETPLARFLRSKGTPADVVENIIHRLQNESEESRIEIIETALESVNETHSWLPRHLKNREDCRQWLEEVLERAKLPTEAINSILIGLERNLAPAKRELTRILSRRGYSKFVIEWLITKMSGLGDE